MRFHLRTLLIVLALGPPALTGLHKFREDLSRSRGADSISLDSAAAENRAVAQWRKAQLGLPQMFRFTIRDVLWLMVVVGLGVGWWLEHLQSQRYQSRLSAYEGQVFNLKWIFSDLAKECQALVPDAIQVDADGTVSVKTKRGTNAAFRPQATGNGPRSSTSNA